MLIFHSSYYKLIVTAGPLEVSNCVVKWDFEPNAWQLYSKMEIFIHQQDQYGNLVPGLYEFDAEVVETGTNLSIPVPDLHFEEVAAGIQLFSFTNLEPGNFLLTISDMKHDKSISNMPYAYTVFVGEFHLVLVTYWCYFLLFLTHASLVYIRIGYCNGTNSVVNGTGLNSSMAGERSEFSVYLNDAYQNPSPVGIERLEIQILREIDFYHVQSSIFLIQIINGTCIRANIELFLLLKIFIIFHKMFVSMSGSGPARGIRYGTTNQIEFAPSPSVTSINSVRTVCIHRCIYFYTYYFRKRLEFNFVQFLNADCWGRQHFGNCFQCGIYT